MNFSQTIPQELSPILADSALGCPVFSSDATNGTMKEPTVLEAPKSDVQPISSRLHYT